MPRIAALVFAASRASCGGLVAPGSSSLASEDAAAPAPLPPEEPDAPRRSGWLSVITATWAEDEGATVSAQAWFGHASRTPPTLPSAGCAVRRAETTPPPATIGSSAGELTFFVGSNAPSTLTLPWDEENLHYELASARRATPPRETLRFRASGGDVPAFEGTHALLTVPVVHTPVPNAAVGSDDLDVSWSAEEDADVVINVSFGWQRVECVARGAGHIVVPGPLLREAKELDQAEYGRRHDATLVVGAQRASSTTSGDWAIEIHDFVYRGLSLTRDE